MVIVNTAAAIRNASSYFVSLLLSVVTVVFIMVRCSYGTRAMLVMVPIEI